MKKVYIAKRIVPNSDNDEILSVDPNMSIEDISKAYFEKKDVKEGYIRNGHWVLRPVIKEGELTQSLLPKSTTPKDIQLMVQQKIDDSDVFIGIINQKSYGTIIEAGYAAGQNRIPVYILPEKNLEQANLEDLWLVMQFSFTTSHLWSDADINSIPIFKEYEISNVFDYQKMIHSIIPPFLK